MWGFSVCVDMLDKLMTESSASLLILPLPRLLSPTPKGIYVLKKKGTS